MSKGDRPRKPTIPLVEFNSKLDTIFGVKPQKERWVAPPLPVDEPVVKKNIWATDKKV